MRLKESVVDTSALKGRGRGHSELCTVIMKDMKQHTSSRSPDTISVVMAAAGKLVKGLFIWNIIPFHPQWPT